MTNIECYMNDGANWQAQSVLAYLRDARNIAIDKAWNEDNKCYDAGIKVGRYENCREQGYIFSIKYLGEQRNYCVYEHRNSDDICVVVFDVTTINTPTLKMVCGAMGDSKWNYTKAFPFGQIMECGDYILDDMKKWIDGFIKNKKD